MVWLKGRHTPIGAITRGRFIYSTEQFLHIAIEKPLQNFSKPFWNVCNVYYDFAHVSIMGAFLLFVVICHRDKWRYFRRVFFVATFTGLIFQFALSSAPPRFIGKGILDTAAIHGMSIYHAAGSAVDQYSTFPSLHVAWAAIIAIVGYQIGGKLKYFWFTHLFATIYVVIATGNHFVLDCISGVFLVLFAIPISRFRLIPQIP